MTASARNAGSPFLATTTASSATSVAARAIWSGGSAARAYARPSAKSRRSPASPSSSRASQRGFVLLGGPPGRAEPRGRAGTRPARRSPLLSGHAVEVLAILASSAGGEGGDEGCGGTAARSSSLGRDVVEELPQRPVQQGHAGIVIEALLGLEANPQLFDDRGVALVALGLERSLEIGDETGTELERRPRRGRRSRRARPSRAAALAPRAPTPRAQAARPGSGVRGALRRKRSS